MRLRSLNGLFNMKILHILPSLDPTAGGPVEGVRQIVEQHLLMGVHSCILSFSKSDNIVNVNAPCFQFDSTLGIYGVSVGALNWLKKNYSNFDAIIIHGIWQFHSIAGSLIAKIGGKKYFIFSHGMLAPWFKSDKIKHLKKYLYWILFEKFSINNANAVFFTCEQEMIDARGCFVGYSPIEKVVGFGTAGRPRNLDPNQLPVDLNYKFNEVPYILFLGRLHPIKACDILIKAFHDFYIKNEVVCNLIVAGPSDKVYEKYLKDLVVSLGLVDRVFFLGMVYGEKKWNLLQNARCLALVSHHENFGVTVGEALSCAVPVIVSRNVNIWRDVVRFESGYVVNTDVHDISKSFADLFLLKENELFKIKSNSLVCFKNVFSVEIVCQKIVNAIDFSVN